MTLIAAPATLEMQLTAYGEELRHFLEHLPAEMRRGRQAELRQRCAALVNQLQTVQPGERWVASWEKMQQSLAELRVALDNGAARKYVHAKWEEAARAYEGWLKSWKAAAATRADRQVRALESLKPLGRIRSVFHMVMGLTGVTLYQFVLSRQQTIFVLLVLLGMAVVFETTRRMSRRWNRLLLKRLFLSMARPHEYERVNSASWYLLALCLLVPVFSKPAVIVGVLILAFADPAAAWIGRAYGRVKLYRNKSVLGTLAFFAAGTLVTSVFLLVFYPDISLARRLLAAGAAAAVSAVVEVYSTKLDDNLTIPIAGAMTAALFV